MKTLIVEDDFVSRLLLLDYLKNYGLAHVAVTGKEAVTAVKMALDAAEPYNLICLDIMLPEMDGQAALRRIRRLEQSYAITPDQEAKIFMTTALTDPKNVISAFFESCDSYLVKPIARERLLAELKNNNLISS